MSIVSILQSHLWAIVGTFITQYVWSAFVSALPAPTSASSTTYQFWFKFLNILAANIARAQRTAIENSPNWAPAVQQATGVDVTASKGKGNGH
jgi:hypothetical protein